ncbi:hypothetical protein NEA10_03415 [Phormidium yuhuli AB48]|uniref:Uncharacterized protein n=1 Tax=Phormidium yuhuli AB48 TaxID=2940671 RepID=A0ABY5ARY4_9CYAN|nr:hypothetical protein [Phormidium yuhuli]USR91790.1 hypothetical protein NEA10_03415 [Phormidium yuhuli AB48]
MASEKQVKKYLADWFQLGKKLVVDQNEQLPSPLFENGHYSDAFEACWRAASCPQFGHKSYLQGTEITLAELLDDHWEITSCARCTMPIALPISGVAGAVCPCHDLPSWPNTALPKPRQAVNTQVSLREICRRLVSSDD